MTKLFELKKGRLKFYACRYDCGMYTIDRITKAFAGTVATFETLEDLEEYVQKNGYKTISLNPYYSASFLIPKEL